MGDNNEKEWQKMHPQSLWKAIKRKNKEPTENRGENYRKFKNKIITCLRG